MILYTEMLLLDRISFNLLLVCRGEPSSVCSSPVGILAFERDYISGGPCSRAIYIIYIIISGVRLLFITDMS